MKKKRFRSFAGRLTRRFIIVMLVTMTLTAGLMFAFTAGGFTLLTTEHYMDVLENADAQISIVLNTVEVSSVHNVDELRQNLDEPEQVKAALASELRLNPHVVGCGAGFIPDYYRSQGRWFEPHAHWEPDGSVSVTQIGSASHDYLQMEWYRRGLESTSGSWSEPYFDEAGAKDQLCTYVLPLRDGSGRIVGVFGADLSLSWLSEKLREIDRNENDFSLFSSVTRKKQNPGLYSFILDRKGGFVVHPDSTRILRDNFFNHTDGPDPDAYTKIGQDMIAGERGYARTWMDGKEVFVNYAPLEHTGWSMGIVIPKDVVQGLGINFSKLILTVLALSVLLVFLLLYWAIRRSTRPLVQLSRSAQQVARGQFDAPLPAIRYNDEVCLLRDSFADMQQSLKQYIGELTEATTQRASMERELEIARGIQMSMLPVEFPENGDVDIFASLTPAKAVGGDLYDFFFRDGRLFFCIGDASGKGVPAALVMAAISTQFRTLSVEESEPARLVSALNDSLAARNETMMFATLFVGVLDLADGVLRYCNAGHDAPVIIGADGGVSPLDVKPNLAIGVQEGQAYEAQQTRLVPGSTVFLYTDGLTEAENRAQALFGSDRLLETVRGLRARNARELLDGMTEAVRRFADGAEQSDDLTMMAIRYILSGK